MADLMFDMLTMIGYILLFVAFFALIICSGVALGVWLDFGADRTGSQAGGAVLMIFSCIAVFAIEVARVEAQGTMKDLSFLQGCLLMMMRTYVETIVTLSVLGAFFTYIWRWYCKSNVENN